MIPLLLFPLLLATVTIEVLGQHSANSLQAAIEALHRHHDILSSQRARHHDPSASSHHQVEDYFTDDTDYPYGENLQQQQQGQLNRALANYLAREGQRERIPAHYSAPIDFDDVGDDAEELGGFDARKRSIFREREETPYKSVFREREQYAQPDLGEEFLEEMEREREEEEEDRYRDTLRRLWDKYQQQENSIERQLFEEQQQEERDAEDEDEEKRKRSFDLDDKRKKKRFGYIPMYIGPVPYKRRDYPMLPWLPAEDRKKRFPVAKRSPKPIPEEANVSGTSDKVAKDLQTLFGGPPAVADDKVKRSTEEAATTAAKLPQGAHKVQKKSDHSFHEQEEEEEEEEDEGHEEHDHDHEEEGHEHEGDDEHEEDEDEDKKKKRAISEAVKSSPEIVKEDQIIPGDLSDYKKKKSVHWDKFLAFGYDKRKKKSVVGGLNGKYRSMMKRQARKKKEVDPEKIDSMDDELKSIEDLIIEETVKYTGAHEGVSNPVEVQKLKDHVISRLATAYSLEKMRRALDQLRENVDTERHLQHNEIEPFDEREDLDGDEDDLEKKKKKRIAVKKDQADEEKHTPAHGHPEAEHEEPEDDEEKKRKKKRKRNGLDFELPENSLDQESGPAGYLEQSERLPDYASASQCPLLNAMEKRCRGVDILSGDIHQELLPICAVHQLCYLCGTSQTSCDLQYLSDADTICGHNNKECEAAARSALMILRGAPGPQLGPRECARNSCLYHAIRDIAY